MHRTVLTVAVCALLIGSAREAAAQAKPWADRAYVNLNVGFESTTGTLNDTVPFRIYDENGTKTVSAETEKGPLMDFSVGGRVWRNISVGLGFHRENTTSGATAEASVPSPIFFNRSRAAALAVDGLDRREQAVHVQFGYMLPMTARLDIHVFGGPSFFRLEQELISDLRFVEAAPFTSVTATPEIAVRKRSKTGANVGADVAYLFYQGSRIKIGAGGFVRFSGASVKLTVLANDVDSKVGRLQAGVGGRIRF